MAPVANVDIKQEEEAWRGDLKTKEPCWMCQSISILQEQVNTKKKKIRQAYTAKSDTHI